MSPPQAPPAILNAALKFHSSKRRTFDAIAQVYSDRALDSTAPFAEMSRMLDWLNNYITAQKKALDTINPADLVPLIATLREAHRAGRRIYVCGNGGSAANSSHFVTDLGKNSSEAMPSPFRVMSLTDNTPWITAIGNDYSFDDSFVRQLKNYGEAGDVLLVISVSGNSPNLVKALEWAKPRGMKTIALVGGKRGRAAELADQVIVIEDTHYGRVEDVQMNILHMLCYVFVEREDARK